MSVRGVVRNPLKKGTSEMSQRLNYFEVSAELSKHYLDFSASLKKKAVIKEFNDLVTIRASQINGCGFCLDMHVKQAKIGGERELRLHHIAIWRESPLFSARERAALELSLIHI